MTLDILLHSVRQVNWFTCNKPFFEKRCIVASAISRSVFVNVLIQSAGKLSIKQLAEKLQVDEKDVRSSYNSVKNTYNLLKKDSEENPNKVLDNGKTNIEYLQIVEDKFGVDLCKVKPRDTRGKPKMEISEKLGLSDLEI